MSRLVILTRADVEALLDLDALVAALAAAMAELSAGRASVPARIAALIPERHALLAAMPAHLPSANALTTKLVSLFPDNRDRPTHQAIICAFDPATGTPLALMDGTYITEARTAASSALATRLLARAEASRVTVIGTGVQAHAHAKALARLPAIKEVRIAGRQREAATALATTLERELDAGVEMEAAGSVEEGVRWADVVCAATHTSTPVVRREWLRPGTHVNSVGFNTAGEGEIDLATIRDALLFVESRAAALAPPPAGAIELLRAIDAGIIGPEHIRAEIGELVSGQAVGRTDRDQITLYKSVGVAVQDAAAAALVLVAAHKAGAGTTVEL